MAPFTLRNILVPIDLSDASLNAAEQAGVLAQASGAGLHLLHVAESLPLAGTTWETAAAQQDSYKDVLSAFTDTLSARYQVPVNLLLETGPVTENILQAAGTCAADLIVMGKHGASGIRDGFAGHNAYYTIKYSTVPVLTVPASYPPALFPHIIYPFRLLEGTQMRQDLVLPFAQPGGTVELLSIAQKLMGIGDRALHDFAEQVRAKCTGKRLDVTLAQGTSLRIGKELVQYACRNAAAMVVVNSALDMNGNENFIGPHAQLAINGLKCPLLFMPINYEQTVRSYDLVSSRALAG